MIRFYAITARTNCYKWKISAFIPWVIDSAFYFASAIFTDQKKMLKFQNKKYQALCIKNPQWNSIYTWKADSSQSLMRKSEAKHGRHGGLFGSQFQAPPRLYIYIYIYNIINNSRRKDKGNQWHDGGCISDTKFCWFT